ncbi:hypothetical protein ACFSTC_29505 [Nonomuraea ferruginea]
MLYEVLSGRAPAPSLTGTEREAIVWARPPRGFRGARWSAADLVLLDELAGLIERPRGYGHVIVDEAQDLSPMQCRAVARRSEHGSLTVLGDLAQGTTPWAAASWPERMALLGKPEARVVALTAGFRVPAEVVEVANRLLGTLKADVPVTRAHRAGGRLRVRASRRPGRRPGGGGAGGAGVRGVGGGDRRRSGRRGAGGGAAGGRA